MDQDKGLGSCWLVSCLTYILSEDSLRRFLLPAGAANEATKSNLLFFDTDFGCEILKLYMVLVCAAAREKDVFETQSYMFRLFFLRHALDEMNIDEDSFCDIPLDAIHTFQRHRASSSLLVDTPYPFDDEVRLLHNCLVTTYGVTERFTGDVHEEIMEGGMAHYLLHAFAIHHAQPLDAWFVPHDYFDDVYTYVAGNVDKTGVLTTLDPKLVPHSVAVVKVGGEIRYKPYDELMTVTRFIQWLRKNHPTVPLEGSMCSILPNGTGARRTLTFSSPL